MLKTRVTAQSTDTDSFSTCNGGSLGNEARIGGGSLPVAEERQDRHEAEEPQVSDDTI